MTMCIATSWDGRVQRVGYDPYILVPSDPAVSGLHTPETRHTEQPGSAEPISGGRSAFLPGCDRDPRINLRVQSRLRSVRKF